MPNRIRELREERGISLKRLELLSGVDRQTIWRWERHQSAPNVEGLYDVAKALGVTLSEIHVPESEAGADARGENAALAAAGISEGE